MTLVRYQALRPGRSGRFPGVFALMNGLGTEGRLDEHEHATWRRTNTWFEAHLRDPFDAEPVLGDRTRHANTSSWFRADAVRFLHPTRRYLRILDRHDVPWIELHSDDPGTVLYADDHQIVVDGIHDPAALGSSIRVVARGGGART